MEITLGPETTDEVLELLAEAEGEGLADPPALAVLARLARYDDEERALKANYEALLREIGQRREHVLRMYGPLLEAWTAAQLRGKRRSVRTLHGVAGFRTVPARLQVVDEEDALHWVLHHEPDAVEPKIVLSRLPLAKFQQPNAETGELEFRPPAGFEVRPERQQFYVKSGQKSAAGASDAEEG